MILGRIGVQLTHDPTLTLAERCYIRIFGVPISGLRIRLRRVLPRLISACSSGGLNVGDFGCGRGVFCFELAQRFPGLHVVGLDIDAGRIGVNSLIARRCGFGNLRFEVADVAKPTLLQKLDVAVSIDNLEHIHDDRSAVRALFDSLVPGGLLICHVPAAHRMTCSGKLRPNFDVPGHVRTGYRREELHALLADAGFDRIQCEETFGFLETLANNVSYWITGAEQRNRYLYAIFFPILNAVAWFGRGQDPRGKGAGLLVTAFKPRSSRKID